MRKGSGFHLSEMASRQFDGYENCRFTCLAIFFKRQVETSQIQSSLRCCLIVYCVYTIMWVLVMNTGVLCVLVQMYKLIQTLVKTSIVFP